MTRKEEIEQAWFDRRIQSYHRYNEKSFKEGAEWADKTMIDKACEWLKNTIDDDVLVKCGSVIKCMDVDDFILYFRKAMED